MKKVLCSGGFDPLHVGHLRYLVEASEYGIVTIALNSDAWLMRKKGYVFMPWDQRAELVRGLFCISGQVRQVDDDDGTICSALRQIKPDILANGGDRTKPNPAEHAICEELGIEEIFDVGGDKIASSSDLVVNILDTHPLRYISQ